MGLDIIFIVGPKNIDLSDVNISFCDCKTGDNTCCNMWEENEYNVWSENERMDRMKLREFRFYKPDLSRNNIELFTLLNEYYTQTNNTIYFPIDEKMLSTIINSKHSQTPKMNRDLSIISSMLELIDFDKECVWVEFSM